MSKLLRRGLSLMFVLALLLSLALPACAEGSISESEPLEDAAEAEAPAEEGSISAEEGAQVPAAPAYVEIYVSASGDDMADGSREAPLASLAAAADLANSAAENTVYVILLSDLTVTRTARFNGKNVILMSEEGTALVTRGSNFETAYDALRQAYHPAMIELGELQSAEPKSTALSLDNVVLDDAGLHEGGEYLAQSTDPAAGVNNLERVQDAIVALYGSSSLTLNPGSELRNFGGMSAVRAVGGASVTVEDYSAIKDTAYIASPAGLKAISDEGAQVRIGTYATVIERVAVPAEEPAAGEAAAESGTANEASDETAPAAEAKSANETEEVPFLALAADAAEPQDGGDEGGDQEPGSDWDNIIKGLTDIIADQIPELSPDFIRSLLNGFSPEYLSDLFKQLTGGGEGGSGDPGSISDIIGDLIGGGGGSDVDIPGINTGSSSTLSFNAPESLVEGEDGPPYLVPYKASVTLPGSLVTVINFMGLDRVESGRIKLVFKLDSRLDAKAGEDGKYCSVTGNIFEISEESYSAADKSISAVLTLKDGWKDHGDELGEAIDLRFGSELPDSKFDPEAEKLVSTARLGNFVVRIASRNYDGGASDVELKAETKMLSSEGAWLTYDINGGEGGPDPNPVFAHTETGYKLEQENVPTHIDMNQKPVVFLGWTAEKDENIYARGGTAPATLSTVDIKSGEDRTVYAVYGFDENEDGIPDVNQRLVQLSFDPNGGTGEPDPILALAVANVGASIEIPEQEPFLKYYTFLGWSKDPNATAGEYKHDAAKKADRDILITKDTVLYAVWQVNPTYTLYYNANGGSGAPAAQSGISDENDSVELVIASGQPTRSGYSFQGWAVSRGGAASYFAGNKVKITGGNVTLYAVWQKGGSSYNGGGSGTTAPKTGDEAPIALYAALAVISLGAVGVGAWLLLRNQKRKK